MMQRFDSFAELADALAAVDDREPTTPLTDDGQVDVETTDSVFCGLLHGGYPDPAVIYERCEELAYSLEHVSDPRAALDRWYSGL